MPRGAWTVLLGLAMSLLLGCNQDQMINKADRQSFYEAPPTISQNLLNSAQTYDRP